MAEGVCKFGARCYRKHPDHVRRFHPEKIEEKEEEGDLKENQQPTKRGKRTAAAQENTKSRKRSKHAVPSTSAEPPLQETSKKLAIATVNGTAINGTDGERRRLFEKMHFRAPTDFLDIWSRAYELNSSSPSDAFSSIRSLRLVGPFDLLAGKLLESGFEALHWRFSCDLPEMISVAIFDGGRVVYWRDDPDEDTEFVGIVWTGKNAAKREQFPELDIVGKTLIDALVFLEGTSRSKEQLFSVDDKKKADKSRADAKKSRQAKSMGVPFHGVGIRPVIRKTGRFESGYRPLHKSNDEIRRRILAAATVDGDEHSLAELRQLQIWTSVANDEGDFGMGLEFGHDLWWSGCSGTISSIAAQTMAVSYELMGRHKFADLIRLHAQHRRETVENLSREIG